MKKIIIFFICFLFLISNTALCADAVSLNSLVAEALKNNPQIKAAKFRWEAARSRVKLLRTLADPKFEFEYDKIIPGMISSATNENMSPMRTFSVSQEIPFPSKLMLRKKASQKEAESYEQEYKETQNKIIKELKDAYFQLFLIGKKKRLIRENLDLLAQFVDLTSTKYSVNKAGQQDVLKAQVEYSKLSNQLVLFEQEEKISQSMLNSLLNRSQDSDLGGLEEKSSKALKIEEQDVLMLAKDSRPELKSFKQMLRKSEIDYALSKQEYMPDIMLKYKREEKNGGLGSWAGMVGVTIPLWFWEKQNSFVREAEANLEQMRQEYNAQENMVLFEARSSLAKFEAAKKLVDIYETGVLPQALAAVETARSGYVSDKIGFLDLLDSLRTLKDFQMEYFEAQANLEIALADLERSVGAGLSWRGEKS